MSDRLTLAHAFEEAGFAREKAERVASVVYDVIHGTVASKADIEVAAAGLRRSIRLLQWQVGLVIAALVGIGLPFLWLLVRVTAKAGALPI